MILESVTVSPFKSINDLQAVAIDAAVTVLVGMNESGKTVFLQSLEKSNDALGVASFNPIEDYPRKDLSTYLQRHKKKATLPTLATQLTYRLNDSEVEEINNDLRTRLKSGFTFSVTHYYDNSVSADISVEERPVIQSLLEESTLSSDARAAIKSVTTIRSIPELLANVSLTEEDKAFLEAVGVRVSQANDQPVVTSEAWEWIKP